MNKHQVHCHRCEKHDPMCDRCQQAVDSARELSYGASGVLPDPPGDAVTWFDYAMGHQHLNSSSYCWKCSAKRWAERERFLDLRAALAENGGGK